MGTKSDFSSIDIQGRCLNGNTDEFHPQQIPFMKIKHFHVKHNINIVIDKQKIQLLIMTLNNINGFH